MIVIVNSLKREVPADATVQVLLETMGLTTQRIAIEVNQELVTKLEWGTLELHEGDHVEIVSFVGGG